MVAAPPWGSYPSVHHHALQLVLQYLHPCSLCCKLHYSAVTWRTQRHQHVQDNMQVSLFQSQYFMLSEQIKWLATETRYFDSRQDKGSYLFLSLLLIVSTRNADHPAFRSIEHRGLTSGVKRIMHNSKHLLQSGVKIENKWSYTYTLHTSSRPVKGDGFNKPISESKY